MVEQFVIGAGDKNLGDRPIRETFEEIIKNKGRSTFKTTFKRLSETLIPIGNEKVSVLNLTPNQLKSSPDIVKYAFTNPESHIQKLEAIRIKEEKAIQPYLFSVLRDLDQVINVALVQKGQKLAPIQSLLKSIVGEKKFEELTLKSGVGKNRQYFFPDNFYSNVTKAISTLSGEAKNIATVVYLGGFRREDLAKFRIENLDLDTGIIYKTKTKAGSVNGYLTPPMLDIIKKQVGDRKSGLVFNNMNAAEKKVNAALKIFFPKEIDYVSPFSDKVQSMNLTFQTLRHANEELYNEEGIPGNDKHRKVVTLRAISEGFKKGESYGSAEIESGEVKEIGSRMNAKLGGYDGKKSPAEVLKAIGYEDKDISEETKKIVVRKGDLRKQKFIKAVKEKYPGFMEGLPEGVGTNYTDKPLDTSNTGSISAEATEESRARALKLKKQNIKTERELLPEEEKLRLEKEAVKEKAEKEKEEAKAKKRAEKIDKNLKDSSDGVLGKNISDITENENLDLSNEEDVSKMFDSLLDKDKFQKFVSDNINNVKDFFGDIHQGAMERHNQQVKEHIRMKDAPFLDKFAYGAGMGIDMATALTKGTAKKAASFIFPKTRDDISQEQVGFMMDATEEGRTKAATQIEKQKAAKTMLEIETQLQEDQELPEEERVLGDQDPESFENRQRKREMLKLFSDPNFGA